MNTIYKSKWNESTCTWVACSELTRGKTKSNCLKIVASIALALATTSTFAATNCPAPSSQGEIEITVNCDIPSSENNRMEIKKLTAIESEVNAQTKDFVINHSNTNGSTSTAVNLESSTLDAGSIHITNSVSGKDSKALSLDSSTLNIQNNNGIQIQNENNATAIAALVNLEDKSTLNLNKSNLKIVNKAADLSTILNNANSTINDADTIHIEDFNGGASTFISNTGSGKINANNIKIIHQGDKPATGITQYSSKGKDKPQIIADSIRIEGQFQHAIKVERGDITSNHLTRIDQQVSKNNLSSTPYAIYIANGSYTSNGNTTININNQDETNGNSKNTEIPGIGLGDNGVLTNNGEITVNGGLNTAIRNFGTKIATINNNGTIITQKGVDSIVNGVDTNSQGNLIVNNTGKLESKNPNNTTTAGSVLKNSGKGEVTINNTGALAEIKGNITNEEDGKITIDNSSNITSGNIINKKEGKIEITNDATLENRIINEQSGTVTLTNQVTSSSSGNIENKGTGSITIYNQGRMNGDITNSGDKISNIAINNNGNGMLTGNIVNQGEGTIRIINEQSLLAPISNNKTGRIEFTNKEAGIFENSSLTNKGSGQIQANNAGSFNDIHISNDGAGSNIDFTNTGIFSGSLTSINSGTITATNSGTFTGTTNNNINSNIYNNNAGIISLKNFGMWENTDNSTLTNLTNQGTITFNEIKPANARNTSKYHSITVDGNYTGDIYTHIDNINKDNAKSKIQVTTLWNQDDPGATNRINITGDVTGATWVDGIIYGNINKPEENEVDSQPVIHVNGTIDSSGGFKGSAKIRSSASEAQLKRIEHEDGTNFVWTLFAEPKPDPVKPAPIDPIEPPPIDPIEPAPTEPVKPINPVPPKRVPIYAEPVSGYVQMPTANMELGFTTIGTLHERRSENQTNNINSANNTAFSDTQQQTWGRVVVEHLDKNGKKRLDTAGSQSVLQIGHDFILDNNAKTGARRHIGGYVSYGHNENDFRDQYRAENGYIVDDHYTGKGRTDAVSIGGYGTFYGNNGGYVDLVSQVTYLRNKYNARSNESVHQNGWGAALSAEAGKSFIVYGNNWFVEPQAQLVYQYLSLDDFNDRYRHIDQHNPSALRGRMGMRFGYNGDTTDNLPPSSFYGIANIWHDFVNPKSVDIGRDTLKEEYAKTWGEIGAGIQWSITRQSDFYGDVRYEKNFGSDKRKGFKGTLGYKYTWL